MSKVRKIVIFFFIVFIIVSFIRTFLSVFSDWSVDDIRTEETVKTDLGDEFLILYDYSDFPDIQTMITIKDKINNKRIAYFTIEDKVDKTNLINVISTSNIRCYEAHNILIYKVNNDNFKWVGINEINELEPAEYQSLVTVCNTLVDKNEWKWIKDCAKFLLNSGNTDIMNRLQNYAKGQFTHEEIDKNKNSDITKEDIQSFSKQLINQYKISAKNPETYIGKWKVEKVIKFSKISGIDDEEINEIIRKKLTYTENEIKFYNVSLKNPYYKKTKINNSDFFNEGYRNLKEIGINRDSVVEVEIFIKKTDNYAYYWNKFGGAFIIKDKNTLIVDYKGAYFELKRIK